MGAWKCSAAPIVAQRGFGVTSARVPNGCKPRAFGCFERNDRLPRAVFHRQENGVGGAAEGVCEGARSPTACDDRRLGAMRPAPAFLPRQRTRLLLAAVWGGGRRRVGARERSRTLLALPLPHAPEGDLLGRRRLGKKVHCHLHHARCVVEQRRIIGMHRNNVDK